MNGRQKTLPSVGTLSYKNAAFMLKNVFFAKILPPCDIGECCEGLRLAKKIFSSRFRALLEKGGGAVQIKIER